MQIGFQQDGSHITFTATSPPTLTYTLDVLTEDIHMAPPMAQFALIQAVCTGGGSGTGQNRFVVKNVAPIIIGTIGNNETGGETPGAQPYGSSAGIVKAPFGLGIPCKLTIGQIVEFGSASGDATIQFLGYEY